MHEFSFYTSPIEPGKSGHINNETYTIDKLFAVITDTSYKSTVESIRAVINNKKEQDKLKKKLPYFTVSGVFKSGTRKAETIVKHSGLIQIDIDEKDNNGQSPDGIKGMIANDSYLVMIFISPSGTGVKAIAKIPADISKHKESFAVLENHFKAQYGLVIDKQCKDIARPFFVSYDPSAIHKDAIQITIADTHKVQTINTSNNETEHEKKIRHIDKLCKVVEQNGIDMTNDYQFYINIGFAIADGLGEQGREYYHRLCRFYPNYNVEETNRQFEACKKPGGRKWQSLFGIAADYGIVLYPHDANKGKPSDSSAAVNGTAKNQIDNSKGLKPIKFWNARYKNLDNDTKQFKDVIIDDLKLLELLKSFGYRRHDVQGGFTFVQVIDNIVSEVQIQHIQDRFISHLKKLPEKVEDYVYRDDLESKIVKQSETLFGKPRLSHLRCDEQLVFNQDTKNESFVYYSNGYVKCTKEGFNFQQYSSLQKAIWKSQLKERNFIKLPEDNRPLYEHCGCYAKFIWNVAGKNNERFFSLMSLIGYLLHDFKEAKLKAVVLTDSKLSDDNNGRTGKTLFGKAIEHIRDVCELNGKEFKADKAFKYQEAKLSTQIIFLNDAVKRFNLEALYNDITEGVTIEKKNQSPVKLKVKYLITTNATIKSNGASSRDRITEYEFAEHYSDKYHPRDEFGHWFFTEWDNEEWNRFDNFMMICISLFLENGIIEPDPVNLNNRKLIDQTSKQFFDFIEARHIVPAVEFSLQGACAEFQELYPEYDFHNGYPTRKFSGWLKILPDLHLNFAGMKMEKLRKDNADIYYIFK